jgi:hypothetical protein
MTVKSQAFGLLFQAGIVIAHYLNRVNSDPLTLSMTSRDLPDSRNSRSSDFIGSFGSVQGHIALSH